VAAAIAAFSKPSTSNSSAANNNRLSVNITGHSQGTNQYVAQYQSNVIKGHASQHTIDTNVPPLSQQFPVAAKHISSTETDSDTSVVESENITGNVATPLVVP
jgi:uncharacterized lipoprotein YajG